MKDGFQDFSASPSGSVFGAEGTQRYQLVEQTSSLCRMFALGDGDGEDFGNRSGV
jgi:hypothetical protein